MSSSTSEIVPAGLERDEAFRKRLFDYAAARQNAGESLELSRLRKLAAEYCAARAWPGVRDEEWRRSRVDGFDFEALSWAPGPEISLFRKSFDGSASTETPDAEPASRIIPWLSVPGDGIEESPAGKARVEDCAAFVRIQASAKGASVEISCNRDCKGLVVASLSELGDSTTGGVPFSANLRARAAVLLNKVLENARSSLDDRFVLWNLAAWNTGIVVYVPKGLRLDKPVVLDWDFSGEDTVHQPLLVVFSDEDSTLEIVQRMHGEGGFLVNYSQYSSVHESAHFSLSTVQDCSSEAVVISHGSSVISRNVEYKHSEAVLGGGFVKSRITVDIDGSGSDVHLYGLYVGDKEEHVDLRTVQNHNAERSTSRAFYKGVVKDEAKTVYQGLIKVSPNAGGTDAFLTNRNLVLNDGARADSIPSLRIQTDDVKCSHGSTTGKIDPEEIFYLESRGIEDARTMLVLAYLEEAGGHFPGLVQGHLRDAVSAIVSGR